MLLPGITPGTFKFTVPIVGVFKVKLRLLSFISLLLTFMLLLSGFIYSPLIIILSIK
jgi:hypothetical protein